VSKNNIHIQGTKQVDMAPGLEQESAMRRKQSSKPGSIKGTLDQIQQITGDVIRAQYDAPAPIQLLSLASSLGTNTLLGGGLGTLINAIKGKSLLRGLTTGGMTGMGMTLGSAGGGRLGYMADDPTQIPFQSGTPWGAIGGGLAGAPLGGIAGYQLAQLLQGKPEKKKKKEEKQSAYRSRQKEAAIKDYLIAALLGAGAGGGLGFGIGSSAATEGLDAEPQRLSLRSFLDRVYAQPKQEGFLRSPWGSASVGAVGGALAGLGIKGINDLVLEG
jgi:hypothetical protein